MNHPQAKEKSQYVTQQPTCDLETLPEDRSLTTQHPNFHTHSDTNNTSIEPNSIFYDDDAEDIDLSSSSDPEQTKKAIEKIESKINVVKEKIHREQSLKEEIVNEFLKLCSQADRQQQSRMKQLFEKKNQKSAQNIAQLQKKLEEYQKRLRDLEKYGVEQKSVREKVHSIRSVGNIIAKPKELAHKLRHKFGSADNLNNLSKDVSKDARNTHGSSSLPRDNPGSRSVFYVGDHQQSSFEDDDVGPRSSNRSTVASEKSFATSESNHVTGLANTQVSSFCRHDSTEWQAVLQELTMSKEEVEKVREDLDDLKAQMKQVVEMMSRKLEEECERRERLEDQLNDLRDLHQSEVTTIKSGVKDMEDKVQYQSEERIMDIREHLQGLETQLNSLEHQHAQQQYINIDGLNNSESRAIFMKLLTVALNLIHLLLWLFGSFLLLARPFCQTRARIAVSIVIVAISVGAYRQREYLDLLIPQLGTKLLHIDKT